MTDPVQSIRVAAALLQRFPGLMKQASGTSSEVELAIGEANQLYPEIWRHMDEAREALGTRDCAHYDGLRATVLAELGITQIDTRSVDWHNKYGQHVGTTYEKVVHFDHGGYQRALGACKALQNAMPEIDWAELAREDVRAIAAAGSLTSAKYKTSVKIAAAGVGLALATFGVYYVVTNMTPDGVSDDEAAAMRARGAAREAEEKQRHEALEAKRARIDELRATVIATCAPAALAELVKLLREEGQLNEAKKLESTPCLPKRPDCKPLIGGILDRLAANYESVLASPASVSCTGARIGTPPAPAFIVSFPDKGGIVRGLVSWDGKTDVIAFASGPGEILVDIGDVDDDGNDEIVFASAKNLFVTKVVNNAFVDVAGPPSSKKCQEAISIEPDLRQEKTRRDRIIISVRGTRGCEEERRVYKLAGNALVLAPETD